MQPTKFSLSLYSLGAVFLTLFCGIDATTAAGSTAPLTVVAAGTGRGLFSPNDNGKPLVIGQNYKIKAIPLPGCVFSNWVVVGTNAVTNTSALLPFQMAAGLELIATFGDVQAPTVKITTKAGTTSNSVFAITGTARDNVGVTAVWCQAGNGSLVKAATANGYTNWTAPLLLASGQNTIGVYAEDAAGNKSQTESIIIDNNAAGAAPETLAGTTLQVGSGTNIFLTVTFDRDTFSQVGVGGDDTGVGTYTYSQSDPNTAQLVLSFLAPPSLTSNDPGNYITLMFSNTSSGTFTNQATNAGAFTLVSASSAAPASLAGLVLEGADSGTNIYAFTNEYGEGVYTGASTAGPAAGTYTYQPYSPSGALVQALSTNGQTNYIMMNFSGAASSNSYESVSINGTNSEYDNGTFSISGQPTNGALGPISLNGISATVTTIKNNGKKATFTICFGASSYGQFTTDTNEGSSVGIYSFTRNGAKTGQFMNTPLAPADAVTNGGADVTFNFTTSHSATFTEPDGRGTFTYALVTPTVPPSLVGRTLTGRGKAGSGSFTFGNGTFTGSDDNGSGNYTYITCGPQEAMAIMNFTDAADSGKTADLILWFTTATSGSYYDDRGPDGINTGAFTMK